MVRAFNVVGIVFDSFIPTDKSSGKRRNFAFVRFKTEGEAERAVKLLDGKVFEGKKIQVKRAHFAPEKRK